MQDLNNKNKQSDLLAASCEQIKEFESLRIVLGVCGGIAAYKSAYIIRELTRLGAIVRVVMTDSAQEFITPLTLQALSGHEVRTKLFDAQAERAMGHIELARWADLILIAPASANCLAKLAHGLADDLLSTLCLVAESPIMICPAMNRAMWHHSATQTNCQILTSRGVLLVPPEDGSQACGEIGLGRLSDVDTILDCIRLRKLNRCLQGRQLMITAGPTREAIDPVRYIGNRSSGKMGYALAAAAVQAGADVTLVSGPTALSPPNGVTIHYVESAQEMHACVMQHLLAGMIFIGAAAVADYRMHIPLNKKIKKQDKSQLSINLMQNSDIISDVVAAKKAACVIGFAAETNDLIQHAGDKLNKKNLDMVVANPVGDGLGFDNDWNQATVLTRNDSIELHCKHKTSLAGEIIAIIAANLQNSL